MEVSLSGRHERECVGTGRPSTGLARPLTSRERQVLTAIVAACPSGRGELLAQLATARVTGHWKPEGSPSVDLVVDDAAPAAPVNGPILPVDAHVYDEREEYLGELIVWLAEGRLSALEDAWLTDSVPGSLPPPEWLRMSPRAAGGATAT